MNSKNIVHQKDKNVLFTPYHPDKNVLFTPLFDIFKKTFRKYLSLFSEPNLIKESYLFSRFIFEYEYIKPFYYNHSCNSNEKYEEIQGRTYQIKKLLQLKNEPISIIKYHPVSNSFFEFWETLVQYQLFHDGKSYKIHEFSSRPSFSESAYYYIKKYLVAKSELSLTYLTSYSCKNESEKDKINYLKSMETVVKFDHKTIINNFISEELLFDEKEEYDLIVANVAIKSDKYNEIYEEIFNFRLFFYCFLYVINHLVKNGSAILVSTQVFTKITSNLLVIIKKYFDVDLFFPSVNDLYKTSGVMVILRNFKGVSEENMKLLKDIFLKMFQEDSSGIKFKEENPLKYVESFYEIEKIGKGNYDFINKFHYDFFLKRINFLDKCIYAKESLVSLNNKETNELLETYRKEQIISSIIWAKKFHINYFPFNPNTFQNNFEKLILEDMYSFHKEIKFQFSKAEQTNIKKRNIGKRFLEIESNIHLTEKLIDTRKIDIYDKAKKKFRYYRPSFSELDLIKKVKDITEEKSITQAWMKMFEILCLFPLFDKKKKKLKTFHFCEAPGNFISSLNYFVKNRTEVEDLKAYAQSLHPDLADIKDNYGLIKQNPEMWNFGENGSGNITNEDIIKYYKKYMDDVDFITSDCGIKYEENSENCKLQKLDLAQTLAILYNLPKNGNMVIKVFQPVTTPNQLMQIYLLYQNFEKLYFYKSVLNPYSREFYIIGLNYHPVEENILNKLFEMLNEFDNEKTLFETYPESFLFQLEKGLRELADNFIFAIERQIYYTDNYDEIPETKLTLVKQYIHKKNKEWLEKYGFEK
jgi:hypothetical protein